MLGHWTSILALARLTQLTPKRLTGRVAGRVPDDTGTLSIGDALFDSDVAFVDRLGVNCRG
jgi:hypothetical protein